MTHEWIEDEEKMTYEEEIEMTDKCIKDEEQMTEECIEEQMEMTHSWIAEEMEIAINGLRR